MTCRLVVILWDLFYKQLCLLVFLTSQWITKHSKQRNISESVKLRWSCFPRVALKRKSEAGSHFYCEAYARAIRILHQALKWSPHLSVTGTGCLCAGSELRQLPASPSACLDWSEAETLEAEIRISESPGHTVLSSVCIYHPRVDMLKSSVQPNQTCKQKKSSAKRLPDRTVPL